MHLCLVHITKNITFFLSIFLLFLLNILIFCQIYCQLLFITASVSYLFKSIKFNAIYFSISFIKLQYIVKIACPFRVYICIYPQKSIVSNNSPFHYVILHVDIWSSSVKVNYENSLEFVKTHAPGLLNNYEGQSSSNELVYRQHQPSTKKTLHSFFM